MRKGISRMGGRESRPIQRRRIEDCLLSESLGSTSKQFGFVIREASLFQGEGTNL